MNLTLTIQMHEALAAVVTMQGGTRFLATKLQIDFLFSMHHEDQKPSKVIAKKLQAYFTANTMKKSPASNVIRTLTLK